VVFARGSRAVDVDNHFRLEHTRLFEKPTARSKALKPRLKTLDVGPSTIR
jgi:hypothetical protein